MDYDSKTLRSVLEDYGIGIFSVRKIKRSRGGRRFEIQNRGGGPDVEA